MSFTPEGMYLLLMKPANVSLILPLHINRHAWQYSIDVLFRC